MFTGREYDAETGLYYYRARYYHPELGRFMQTDPLGYIGGLNLYAYCGNNATNLRDPAGLYTWNSSFGFGNNLAANVLEAIGDLGALCGSDGAKAYSEGIDAGCAILADSITATANRLTLGVIPRPQSWQAYAAAKKCEYGLAGQISAGLSEIASAALSALAGLRVLNLDMALTETTVYRVCGGQSEIFGASWTPYNPTIAGFRNAAGIGSWNTGEFLVTGTIPAGTVVISQSATAVAAEGLAGGLTEYIIYLADGTVTIVSISNGYSF